MLRNHLRALVVVVILLSKWDIYSLSLEIDNNAKGKLCNNGWRANYFPRWMAVRIDGDVLRVTE